MKKKVIKIEEIHLPLDEMKLNETEIMVIKGGAASAYASNSGSGCGCGCGSGQGCGCGSGNGCGCGCAAIN